MKRLLYTTLFAGLILVLAVAAVFALRGPLATQTVSASAPAVDASAASSLAPTGTDYYNVISIPLDAQQQFTDAGYSFDSQGLADMVPGTVQVLHWDNQTQLFNTYTPGGLDTPFALEVGGVYRLLLDSSACNVVSFVGDVPPKSTEPGHPTYDLYGGDPCKYNVIAIPLDRSDIQDSQDLVDAITGTTQVLEWNASQQAYRTYEPGGFDTPFSVKIGYPYRICSDGSVPAQWP
jgi:hypothetical protein